MSNSNNNIQNVIGKVQKLLALSKQNSNENEMRAAAAAADRLMAEYRISQAELEAANPSEHEEEFVRARVHEGGRRTAWREALLHALTAHYGCCWTIASGRHFEGGNTHYTVIGKEQRRGDRQVHVFLA